MKVKLLVPRASADGAQNRGDVVEVTNAEAERMVAAEQAELIRSQKAPEKAVKRSKSERATK